MKVSVLGIGRVGLPLALYMASKGHEVIGVDKNEPMLEKLKEKKMPFLEEDADSLLKEQFGKNFKVTSDSLKAVSESDYIIITIGTPVDENLNPLTSPVKNVIKEISKGLSPGKTIILRSTLSPGTTKMIKHYLEEETSLKIGENLFLSFCPERIAEGKSLKELPEVPQIIGAFDEESYQKSEKLFSTLCSKRLKTTPQKAELAKLFSNMHRYIQFAVANEFMMISQDHGEEVEEVINLVNEGYKRGGIKSPGFAAGPCLYKDGFFLLRGEPYMELITASWKINEGTPGYLIKKLSEKMDLSSKKVALLGKGFKKDSDDPRNSLSYKAKKIFDFSGSKVMMHDPLIKSESLQSCLESADVIFVATNHTDYYSLSLEEIKKQANPDCIVVDVWNVFKKNKVLFKL